MAKSLTLTAYISNPIKVQLSAAQPLPSVKMMVKESTSVMRVKMKYAKTLNVKVEQLQLMLKDRKLEDGERVTGLKGEVLTATGLSWVF